jgi:hypothetical protein
LKVEIKNHACIVTREPGDPRFSGVAKAKGESRLLYHIKNILNAQGYDLIKKRMWKDGHLVDDMQQYLRTRKATGNPEKDIYIWNGQFAIRGAEEPLNESGTVTLNVETNVFKPSKGDQA